MRKPLGSSVLVVASAMALGCATSPSRSASRRAGLGSVDCVRVSEIDSIGALDDDRHIFVKSGTSTFHLLTVNPGCQGIMFASGFSIGDGAPRVCSDGFAFVTFEHPEHGPTRCRVEWLEPVASKEEAKALIRARAEDDDGGD